MNTDPNMTKTMKQYPCLLSLMFALMMAGCALSPQIVNIRPAVTVQMAGAETDKPELALAVVDKRDSRILGKRGGVYTDTATISTGEDITTPLQQTLAIALERMGYQVTDADSAPVLKVEITALDYSVRKNRVTRTIETYASVNAVFQKGNRTYTNTYRNRQTKDMLTPPSASENETLINETLATALQRMLEDEQLFGLIGRGG